LIFILIYFEWRDTENQQYVGVYAQIMYQKRDHVRPRFGKIEEVPLEKGPPSSPKFEISAHGAH